LKRHATRVLRLSAGSVLLLVGVIGGFIPVLQGWLFILAGLSIMAPESQRARSWLDWVKKHLRRKESASTSARTVQGVSEEGTRR
jgi:uncharacterized membrane protein YbaN (DUF454 family)